MRTNTGRLIKLRRTRHKIFGNGRVNVDNRVLSHCGRQCRRVCLKIMGKLVAACVECKCSFIYKRLMSLRFAIPNFQQWTFPRFLLHRAFDLWKSTLRIEFSSGRPACTQQEDAAAKTEITLWQDVAEPWHHFDSSCLQLWQSSLSIPEVHQTCQGKFGFIQRPVWGLAFIFNIRFPTSSLTVVIANRFY